MKFDNEWQDGFKLFSFFFGLILVFLTIIFSIFLIVIVAQHLARSNTEKDIALWKSTGCNIVAIKDGSPVYKCGG